MLFPLKRFKKARLTYFEKKLKLEKQWRIPEKARLKFERTQARNLIDKKCETQAKTKQELALAPAGLMATRAGFLAGSSSETMSNNE